MSQRLNHSGRGGRGRSCRSWSGKFYKGRGFNKPGAKTQNLGSQQLSQPPKTKTANPGQPCPYQKWTVYMREDVYIPNSLLAKKIDVLYQYFLSNVHQFNKVDIEEKGEVYIDYQALISDTELVDQVPTLSKDIRENPEQTLNVIGLALHQAFIEDQFSDDPNSVPLVFDAPFIQIRLLSYEPFTALKNLKASYFGKLVTIRGTVVKTGNVKPLVTKLTFSCNSCTEEQVVHLTDGKYAAPTKVLSCGLTCIRSDCRGRIFTPLRSSASTETIDWQNIKLQEIILDDQRETGRIPRTVECELTYGLVDSCVPGDMVTCTGIVKVTTSEEGHNRGKDKSMYLLYIHAISISNNKDVKNSDKTQEQSCADFTIKELYAIKEIQEEEKVFRLIVGSLCPAIYGHEFVKAGLILSLFGGSQKFVDEKNHIPIRGDPHILVVGDPGLGKSQMLQAAANIAPRGVYVCGNTTTSSGLTVTLSKDSGTGDYALEAGALVLGDRGCCCIDEFDKMGTQHQALLEAMEQQSISIAKAGIVCSLPARTSILAAANPIGGHYNKAKTVSENLKMNNALLSRFDLVFILVDKPNEEMDGILSEHVMSLHTNSNARSKFRSQSVTVERNNEPDESFEQWQKDKPLCERLKISRHEEFDPIPSQLLRKYIQYARKYVYPKLSMEAAKVLQDFYLDLRKQHQGPNCTPITTRQLEALVRLTEARARLELREKATEQHARDVVEIMKSSLVDTFSDETGSLDYSRAQNGSGMSKRAQCKKFIGELNRISEREQNSLFNMDFMYRIANQLKLQTGDFEDFIATLNNQNFLLKKGPRTYQLQTSSCL